MGKVDFDAAAVNNGPVHLKVSTFCVLIPLETNKPVSEGGIRHLVTDDGAVDHTPKLRENELKVVVVRMRIELTNKKNVFRRGDICLG